MVEHRKVPSRESNKVKDQVLDHLLAEIHNGDGKDLEDHERYAGYGMTLSIEAWTGDRNVTYSYSGIRRWTIAGGDGSEQLIKQDRINGPERIGVSSHWLQDNHQGRLGKCRVAQTGYIIECQNGKATYGPDLSHQVWNVNLISLEDDYGLRLLEAKELEKGLKEEGGKESGEEKGSMRKGNAVLLSMSFWNAGDSIGQNCTVAHSRTKADLSSKLTVKKKARWVIQVRPGIVRGGENRQEAYLMKGTLLRDGVLDWSSFGLSNKLELGWLVLRHLNIDRAKDVELIKVEAEQEVKLRSDSNSATLKGDGSPVSKAGWEHEPIGKHRGYWRQTNGSAMLLRDLKDYLQDTLRMIPQTRIFSQLDDDKDEDEDYNETIQEEDEEQRRKEMKDGVLKPHMSNKNFLISPLDSQPMGWEQARDGTVKEALRDEIKILQGTKEESSELVDGVGMDMAKDNWIQARGHSSELKLAQSKDWSATGKASRGKFLFWGMEVMAQDTLRMEEGFKGLEQDKDSTRITGQKSRGYRINIGVKKSPIKARKLIRKHFSTELKKDKKMYEMIEGRNIDEDIRNTQAGKSAGVAGWLKMPLPQRGEGVIVGRNGWGHWKEEENLGGGACKGQNDWRKITGAMGF
ncbi:hypothetical protein BY996DRAFT_6484350 [Phakopsora pachyrhizi]|nr:hypothetical protein BY996DRAFT_6484350 [Phakopsora pachyrhizi]